MTAATPFPGTLSGTTLLGAPAWNKGTAFTEQERTRFGLHGLLPPYVETLDEQVARAYMPIWRTTTIWPAHLFARVAGQQ